MRPPADLVLIQEPWFGRIGVDAAMAQDNPISDVFGTVSHPNWQALIPPFDPSLGKPDVLAYVPKVRANWSFQLRTDLISVEQARGIFYTTQDTLLLTCRGEGSLLMVEDKGEADYHNCMRGIGIYT